MSDNKYPHKCPACTSPAYEGATAVECTNQKCVHWDGASPGRGVWATDENGVETYTFKIPLYPPSPERAIDSDPRTWLKIVEGDTKMYYTDDEGESHELKGAEGGAFTISGPDQSSPGFWSHENARIASLEDQAFAQGLRNAASRIEKVLAATLEPSTDSKPWYPQLYREMFALAGELKEIASGAEVDAGATDDPTSLCLDRMNSWRTGKPIPYTGPYLDESLGTLAKAVDEWKACATHDWENYYEGASFTGKYPHTCEFYHPDCMCLVYETRCKWGRS